MRITNLLKLPCLIFLLSVTASAQTLLNELDINPGGTDNPCEYIELKGTPGAEVANVYFVSLEGDIGSTPGVATAVIVFGSPGPVLGSNGLLIVTGTQPCGTRMYPAATTVAPVSLLDNAGGALQNGTNSFLFISSPTAITAGTDYDTDNNGTLESLPAGATIVDGVAWTDGGAGDITYGTVVLSAAGGTIGAATRFPGNTTANSAAAWYAGAMTGTNDATTYHATIRSANFPPDGALTPGAPNVGTAVARDAPVDFNGDNRTDYAVARNMLGRLTWYWNLNGGGGNAQMDFGLVGDTLLMEDFDGDGNDDVTVWRAAPGTGSAYYIFQSMTNTVRVTSFGLIGDDATVAGDYDGDGKADEAVYRPGASPGLQSTWFYRGSLNNPSGNITFVPWGVNGDRVAPGDYDGDGRHDFVIRRDTGAQGVWWQRFANNTTAVQFFGLPTDRIVPGDYDGDGKTDLTSLRGEVGQLTWFILPSSGGSYQAFDWGNASTDSAAQGDYDGDGKTDVAVWRIGNPGQFLSRNSTNGALTVAFWGSQNDFVIANYNRH